MAQSGFARLFNTAAGAVDRWRGWDRLPTPLGLLALIGIRDTLRQENLHDTGGGPLPGTEPASPPPARWLGARSVDGAYNDLSHPEMVGRDVEVTISDGRESVVNTITNQFGEFRGEVKNSGDLEITFVGRSGKPIVILRRGALDPSAGAKA